MSQTYSQFEKDALRFAGIDITKMFLLSGEMAETVLNRSCMVYSDYLRMIK